MSTAEDLTEAFHTWLQYFVERENANPVLLKFEDLNPGALLKADAARRFILETLRRSQWGDGYFDLGGNWLYTGTRFCGSAVADNPVSRFFDSLLPLLTQLRNLQVNNMEFAYLQAMSFFDARKF